MIAMRRFTRYGDYEIETFGVLTFNDFTCYTVERPWVDNEPMISCIPAGRYYLHSYTSPKFGKTVILYGGTVAPYPQVGFERSSILIHAANTASELSGCIGLGDKLGQINGVNAVMNSRYTVDLFLGMIDPNRVYNIMITYDDNMQ